MTTNSEHHSSSEQTEPQRDTRSAAQLKADIEADRAELTRTLNALELKFNVPKQLSFAATRVTDRVRELREENPAVIAAGVVIVAAAVGTLTWLGVRAFVNRD